jgi:hypothetical protein
MGAGASSNGVLFERSYHKERVQLRRELMMRFEKDPKNQDILHKIQALRALITQHPHICVTAAEELKREQLEEHEIHPVTLQSAFNELDRLFTIYETSTILKSAELRIGNIACPLGHHAAFFDDFQILTDNYETYSRRAKDTKDKNKILCNICDKVASSGHHCSYCTYSLCVPCSTIYCCNGHALKLWTHAEAEHTCVVCGKHPITSGYHCSECPDYDICDYCTWKEGRDKVQQVIHDRIAKDLVFIEASQDESETAAKTLALHRKKVAENLYPTTKHLHTFSVDLHEIKEVCRLEVIQTRLTKDIQRMRAILVYGKQYSKIAYEESLKEGNFIVEEQTRLKKLCDWNDHLKSFAVRCQHVVACPVSHAMFPFEGLPEQYLKRREASEKDEDSRAAAEGRMVFRKRSKKYKDADPFLAICKICDRIASSGYHCDFCEYDLCHVCAKIYCANGHQMIMWTEPYGHERCFLCSSSPLTMGYRCRTCHVDMCDMCTSLEGRNRIRTDWEQEMHDLIQFMKDVKRVSDVAMYYQWRHANEIVSVGFLIEYVKELREAKIRAERQIQQKPIIDKIKLLRQEIIKNADLCGTAAREANRVENFVFSNKKKANEELIRLADLLRVGIFAQAADRRSAAQIACPLAHAMEQIIPKKMDTEDPDVFDEAEAMAMMYGTSQNISMDTGRADTANPHDRSFGSDHPESEVDHTMTKNDKRNSSSAQDSNRDTLLISQENAVVPFDGPDPSELHQGNKVHPLPTVQPSSELDLVRTASIKASKERVLSLVNHTMNTVIAEFPGHFQPFDNRTCRICGTKDLYEGMTCTYCEYDLCRDCCVIYCRMGHTCKIWTLPNAETMNCELCKKSGITSGYRCLTCNVDICDHCTTKDARNAYLLWPRREFHRIISHLEKISNESMIARNYLKHMKENEVDNSYLQVMSKLCKKLQEIQHVQYQADEEVKNRITTVKVRKYAMAARDML